MILKDHSLGAGDSEECPTRPSPALDAVGPLFSVPSSNFLTQQVSIKLCSESWGSDKLREAHGLAGQKTFLLKMNGATSQLVALPEPKSHQKRDAPLAPKLVTDYNSRQTLRAAADPSATNLPRRLCPLMPAKGQVQVF